MASRPARPRKCRSSSNGNAEGDAALLNDVRSFLEYDEEIEDFIEDPLWSVKAGPPDVRPKERALSDSQKRIGHYRIQRLLGRGGMGTVFLAAREDDYRQQVALKLVSWGMDSDEILGRFYNERQILANLQHPGIARLLDGGTTEDGMPYFVMEYVEGVPIDDYCESHQLPLRRRLKLFRKVCEVIHFAHQNLVVHRDLKPSNILITDKGEPKLLDFGIAKMLQPERIPQAAATIPGKGPMTPDYASPEQILNTPITTACDVYALGVLLYRLLTGHAPYHLGGKNYTEMVNLVCLNEPRRPSTAVGSAQPETKPQRPGAEPPPEEAPVSSEVRRLRRQLAGDLDAIVLKAMRKEPRHRYGSALELSADLDRYLNALPVAARQGTWAYVAGKLVRRHKLVLATVLLLLGFAVATTILWREAVQERSVADRERAEADREKARAESVTDLFIEFFEEADPDQTQGEDLKVREVLDRGRMKIANELEDEPETKTSLLGTLVAVYNSLGLYSEAMELAEEVVEIRRQLYPGDHRLLATAINNLAGIYYSLQLYDKAEQYFYEVLQMRRNLGQEEELIAHTMVNLASTLTLRKKYAEAKKLHLEAMVIRNRLFGPDHPNVLGSRHALGILYLESGDFEQAEPLLRQVVKERLLSHGDEHTSVASAYSSLGRALYAIGKHEEAEACHIQALAIRRKFLGEDHSKVTTTKKNLASVLLETGDVERAGALIEDALGKMKEGSSGKGTEGLADAEGVMGAYLLRSGRYTEAEPYLLRSYEVLKLSKGYFAVSAKSVLKHLVELYTSLERPTEAEKYESILRHMNL